MLTRLLSWIALSRTFKYGPIGKWYVSSRFHVFNEGDVLVAKFTPTCLGDKPVVEVKGYCVLWMECNVGMYSVILYRGIRERVCEEREISKSFLETLFERVDVEEAEEALVKYD